MSPRGIRPAVDGRLARSLCREGPISSRLTRAQRADRQGWRRPVLTRRSLVAAGLLAPVAARAQPASANIVRIVNPFAAGGTSDAMARLLQPSLQQRLGATI